MSHLWEFIRDHYLQIARTYGVDPGIFMGIHLVVTPIFILSVSWLVRNYRAGKDIVLPLIVTILLYNIANVFLVVCGRNIPWYIYALIGGTTLFTGYLSWGKIRKKMSSASEH